MSAFVNWLAAFKAVMWLADRWPWLRRQLARFSADDTDEAGA